MDKNMIDSIYPLSPMQQGLFFHSIYAPDSGTYFMHVSFTFHGALNIDAFKAAWERVIATHPVLRTSINESAQKLLQVVHRQVALPWQQYDWRGLSENEQQEQLAAFARTDLQRGFILAKAPLIRLTLIQLSDEDYRFIWSYHHVILDGWSIHLLLNEVFAYYDAFRQGRNIQLPVSRPYQDYIAWIHRQDHHRAEFFWRQELHGFTSPTPLPLQEPRSLQERRKQANYGEMNFSEQELRLSPSFTKRLSDMLRHYQLTLNTIIQGAWALLLSRYSREEDVVFGVTVSGRSIDLPGIETMAGLFINTLPLRVRVSPGYSIASWLKELQVKLAECRQYEYSSLVQVQSWSEVTQGLPLFESFVVFENYPIDASLEEQSGKAGVEQVSYNEYFGERSNYPLSLMVSPGQQLTLRIIYDRSRFDEKMIEKMFGHLQSIIEYIATAPQRRLSEVEMLTPGEREQICFEWNSARQDAIPEQCAHHIFEGQVERTPSAPALVMEHEQLTYRELNRRANQLAHRLQRLGVGPEVLVGICMERSVEMIVGMLGVLKAGGVYVPLDPRYPKRRLASMLQDAQAAVLLTQQSTAASLPEHQGRVICLDTCKNELQQESIENPISAVTPDNAAYVIYTSGSTGKPKGTILAHRGLSNLMRAMTCIIRPESNVLQFASVSFDASVPEIFVTLGSGSTLYLARQEELMPGPQFVQLLHDRAITCVTLSPSLLDRLSPEELAGVEILISAGEACSQNIMARWSPGRQFFNAYGPTEATVCTSASRCCADGELTIGTPIANMCTYIVDAHLNLLPAGIPGELLIGGVGLARGYLHRADLTAEKFIPNPFSQQAGAQLYRTGDLARYLPDGRLEYLGRMDDQVKIRGFRIEPGEIATTLVQHPSVQHAVVIAREDTPGEKRLVAYVIPQPGQRLAVNDLRDSLSGILPEYMIPAAFVQLDAFPLTPSGKLDLRALPPPEGRSHLQRSQLVPPCDELERQLVQIWEAVLDIHPISVTDDFFALGGHSLLALRLVSEIQRVFQQNLSLSVLFQGPTIEHLADLLRQRNNALSKTPLVAIQPGGSRYPFFAVHPGSGNIFCYYDLARRLGPDQPFYGLQDPDIYEERFPTVAIEDMAARYIEAVREVQAEGPYALGGYSFGGVVAFEMARQLHATGQEVRCLAIFDGVAPATRRSMDDEDDALWLAVITIELIRGASSKEVEEIYHDLRQLELKEQLDYVLEQLQQAHVFLAEADPGWVYHRMQVFKTRTRIVEQYIPPAYPGRVTLFRTSQRDNFALLNEEDRMIEDWSKFTTQKLEVHMIPGYHDTLLSPPQVDLLAQYLREGLEQI